MKTINAVLGCGLLVFCTACRTPSSRAGLPRWELLAIVPYRCVADYTPQNVGIYKACGQFGEIVYFGFLQRAADADDGAQCGYNEGSMLHNPVQDVRLVSTRHGDLIKVRLAHDPYSCQYYALWPRLLLVRIENAQGVQAPNDYLHPDKTIGPLVEFRFRARRDFILSVLLSEESDSNYWPRVAMLQWLGGLHLPDDRPPDASYWWWSNTSSLTEMSDVVSIRNDKQVREQVRRLSKSQDEWLKQAACFALSAMEKK